MDHNSVPEIKNENIDHFGQRIEPYFASSIVMRGLTDPKLIYDKMKIRGSVSWLQHIAEHKRHNYDFYTLIDAREKFVSDVQNKLEQGNSEYIAQMIHKCESDGIELVHTTTSLMNEVVVADLSNEELCRKLDQFSDQASQYCAWYAIAFFEKPELKILETVLKGYAQNDREYEEWFSIATTSSKATDIDREQDALLQLITNGSLHKQSIQQHAQAYGWLGVRFFIGSWWNEQDVELRVKTVTSTHAKQLIKQKGDSEFHTEQVLQTMQARLSPDDMELVSQVRDIVYLRTQRADYFHHAGALIKPLVEEAAKRLSLSYHDALYFSEYEIIEALSGEFSYEDELGDRKIDMLIYSAKGGCASISGDSARTYVEARKVFTTDINTNENVKGTSAYRGIERGRICIVLTHQDLKKFREGDVLVTTMTTPNLISVMEKASAFVTDEGGILCHAAVIARELKKPCIIGTKIATKALKDGVRVEVNANTGVVKILNDSK